MVREEVGLRSLMVAREITGAMPRWGWYMWVSEERTKSSSEMVGFDCCLHLGGSAAVLWSGM